MDWAQISATSALTALGTAILTWIARPYFEAYLRKKGEQRAVIEDLDRINRKLEEIRSDFAQRNSYLAEKGKNAATKEDIEEISRKVESIHVEYTAMIELLKSQLSKRATIHRLQAEKEFEVFSKIWDSAIDLRMATQDLRPMMDQINSDESEQEKWRRKREAFNETYNQFLLAMEKQRPFYPADIYQKLMELLRAARKERMDCEVALGFAEGTMPPGGYKRGQQNMDKVIDTINDLCDVLRTRLSDTVGS